jgi:signal transduction histidine kinase
VISDGVIVCNESGHILLINPAAIRLSGWQTGDATGLAVSSVVHLVDAQNQAFVWDLASIKAPIARNDLLIQPTGEGKTAPVEIHIIPCDANYTNNEKADHKMTAGTNGTYTITIRDIAPEVKSEEARMDFISTASHEMRTPVATIDGYLDLALNPKVAVIDDKARGFLEKAKVASQNLGRLFADLLDVTKIDDHRQEVRYEKVDMNAFLSGVVENMRGFVEPKGLSIQFVHDVNKINPIYYAMTDAEVLRNIMNNLIDNATKYTEKGGVTVRVTADEKFVTIGVRDTGVGIAKEYLPHLFQKFYRVDSRDTREIGGTGLGLYIVKYSVENMSGKIWVESEPGHGTEFFISLPRAR